jgi:hypothetical protein
MKVALVHDWLVAMRGGEKCLEVFCELFPEADLYTLVYAAENVSPAIRRMKIKVFLDKPLAVCQAPFLATLVVQE